VTRRAALALTLLGFALAAAGCGSSSSSVSAPNVHAARTFHLSGFAPAEPVKAGKPFTVSFTVVQPSRAPLTRYKSGPGPHTGVHLIIVRDDLSTIVHEHPKIGANGQITQRLVLPAPGPYRVVVDVYPNVPGVLPNFQLFTTMRASGTYKPQPLPAPGAKVVVDGFTFNVAPHAPIRALTPAYLPVTVTTPSGAPADFTPWFGATAHAIFFHRGTLDYFHTHVCAPGLASCAGIAGVSRITGSSSAPGKLTVGVLVPEPGVWRLFLQCKVDGKILTAPFTLPVAG
jgi:hypothetical protein